MNRRRLIAFSAVVVAAMVAIGAYAWIQLPPDAQVPIHWGPDGTPNGYASKTIGLLLLPLTAAGLAILLAFIPRFEPRRTNLERSGKAYGAIWVGVMLLMAGIQVIVVVTTLGGTPDMSRLTLLGIGVLYLVIGNYLPKVRPNYMMGIRTPWTLTSDLAWNKTHRIGGRLFVAEGLVFIALGLVGVAPEVLAVAIVGGIVILLVVLFAYSYQVWKSDPEKRTA
jgi:uncharacterized membrane protein